MFSWRRVTFPVEYIGRTGASWSEREVVRIAIVGSGVAGLTTAHLLNAHHDVTLFEADSRLGGHAHTHEVESNGEFYPVDTGFMVFNDRCYPLLTGLFRELGIESRPSDMSFSVADDVANVEWRSSNLATIFAQRRNLVRPSFWRMLVDIVRFNRAATALLASGTVSDRTLQSFLAEGRYSSFFVDQYLIPMGAAIWSADPTTFSAFPAKALFRFLDNHGLLSLANRPQWRTVVGGSVQYVDAIAVELGDAVRLTSRVTAVSRVDQGIDVTAAGVTANFDHVVLACHSDEALALLTNATPAEREVLGAIAYQTNVATLHTDASLMPRRERARASWNYRRLPGARSATLTYDVSRLQGHESPETFYVTLNQADAIDPSLVVGTMHYAHPVFNEAAMAAQRRHGEISGVAGVSFAGAYWGYGFHEDGCRSGYVVAKALGAPVEILVP